MGLSPAPKISRQAHTLDAHTMSLACVTRMDLEGFSARKRRTVCPLSRKRLCLPSHGQMPGQLLLSYCCFGSAKT